MPKNVSDSSGCCRFQVEFCWKEFGNVRKSSSLATQALVEFWGWLWKLRLTVVAEVTYDECKWGFHFLLRFCPSVASGQWPDVPGSANVNRTNFCMLFARKCSSYRADVSSVAKITTCVLSRAIRQITNNVMTVINIICIIIRKINQPLKVTNIFR